MAHVLSFDAVSRIMLVAFDGVLSEVGYMAAYDALDGFIATHGPCSSIVDFSAVERFELSTKFARRIGEMRPAIPKGMQRVVVAPQPAIFGTARVVSALRDGTGGEVMVVKTMAEGLAVFGLRTPVFVPVQGPKDA